MVFFFLVTFLQNMDLHEKVHLCFTSWGARGPPQFFLPLSPIPFRKLSGKGGREGGKGRGKKEEEEQKEEEEKEEEHVDSYGFLWIPMYSHASLGTPEETLSCSPKPCQKLSGSFPDWDPPRPCAYY